MADAFVFPFPQVTSSAAAQVQHGNFIASQNPLFEVIGELVDEEALDEVVELLQENGV